MSDSRVVILGRDLTTGYFVPVGLDDGNIEVTIKGGQAVTAITEMATDIDGVQSTIITPLQYQKSLPYAQNDVQPYWIDIDDTSGYNSLHFQLYVGAIGIPAAMTVTIFNTSTNDIFTAAGAGGATTDNIFKQFTIPGTANDALYILKISPGIDKQTASNPYAFNDILPPSLSVSIGIGALGTFYAARCVLTRV